MSNVRTPSIPISERVVKAACTPNRDRGARDLTAHQEECLLASAKAGDRAIRMASQQLATRIAQFHPERCAR